MEELNRLKAELTAPPKTPAAPDMSASTGSISLRELRLPLKADFVCSTANKPGRNAQPQRQESRFSRWVTTLSFQKAPNTPSSSSFELERRTWWPRRWPARTAASVATR